MKKIGQFIYPWGNGHFSRMMRLNDALDEIIIDKPEMHFFSKGEILEKPKNLTIIVIYLRNISL